MVVVVVETDFIWISWETVRRLAWLVEDFAVGHFVSLYSIYLVDDRGGTISIPVGFRELF